MSMTADNEQMSGHDLEGSYSPQMTDLPPEMRPKKIDWSKFKPAGIVTGVLLALLAGYMIWPRSPLSRFKTELRSAVRAYERYAESSLTTFELHDFDVATAESLVRPYEGYGVIEFEAPLMLEHDDLEQPLLCELRARHRLDYVFEQGDWVLTAITSRIVHVFPAVEPDELSALPDSVLDLTGTYRYQEDTVAIDDFGKPLVFGLSDKFKFLK